MTDLDDRPTEQLAEQGFGQKLLSAAERRGLEDRAANGGLWSAAWAKFRLNIDDNRRRTKNATQREKESGGGFEGMPRPKITASGAVGAGGGRQRAIGCPAEYRGTTAQVAGLWPWSVGAATPMIGTPLGTHLETGQPVCFDLLNWFKRAGLITAPSLFILALNGFGKSSLVRRLILGGLANNITPLVLADVKPDYRSTIEACGGQVIDVGYGHGQINPLDGGVMAEAITMLLKAGRDKEAHGLTTALRARQTNLVSGLLEVARGDRMRDFEETLISTALRHLYTPVDQGGSGYTWLNPPILEDLAELIDTGGPEFMLDAAAVDALDYARATTELRRSLRALVKGNFGAVFNGQSTTKITMDSNGLCIDVSHIGQSDRKLKGAVMLTTWNAGFSAVEAHNTLAEAGLTKQRYFQIVMDELWHVLSLGDFMVDRVDELTRLQREWAAALIMISHSIRDLRSRTGDAVNRAIGFLERSRVKIFGALPREELEQLSGITGFTETEKQNITSWSAPAAMTGEPPREGEPLPLPPGVGKWILKTTEDSTPGTPFVVVFTRAEIEAGIHNTSKRFDSFGTQASSTTTDLIPELERL
ncbi:hypothetical protein ACFVVM_32865 [Nocardia sp. NPDC058176]|uniref:hypothetical protein n=1 Tax=Nocardia sp. NPDC058176 TaxID=3346368 RepID=UPI0036D917A6